MRLALGLAVACAACVRYEPQPIDPSNHSLELRARTLTDTTVQSTVARYAGRQDGRRWTDRQLAVVGLHFRTDLRRLRAEWRAAEAGLRRAGERPPVGAQAEVERRISGRDEGSPWVVGVGALFTIELGGKRGARVQAARARVVLAESRMLGAVWGSVSEARRATAELARAIGSAADARQEIRLLEQVETLESARYAEAALGASDLARTASDVQRARLSLAQAERDVLAGRAALAAALAVPVRAIEAIEPEVGPVGCDRLDSMPVDSFVTSAVSRRHEVGLALGEYALAEARVREEVAHQIPDLELGPGFIWDQGVNRWTLALALPALLGSRNRGAIREAEAARVVAGLAVAAVQDSVFADVETAIQGCRGAALELAAADSVVAAADRLLQRERGAYERGETSRLDPARAELQHFRALEARRSAERGATRAALDLARAAGGPHAGEAWPDPRQNQGEEANR